MKAVILKVLAIGGPSDMKFRMHKRIGWCLHRGRILSSSPHNLDIFGSLRRSSTVERKRQCPGSNKS